MPKITAQCDLMKNAFPASVLSPAGQFFAIHDAEGEPMIFSIGTDGRLYLIMRDPVSGSNARIDLSQKFQVPVEHRVTALGVSQDVDSQFYLVFAAGKGNGESKLYLVQPTRPEQMSWSTSVDLTPSLIKGEMLPMFARNFIMGTNEDKFSANTPYPSVFVVYQNVVRRTDDFCELRVSKSASEQLGWSFDDTVVMPVNPDLILDRCVANLDGYRGLFVLFREEPQGRPRMRFVGTEPEIEDQTLISIPHNVPEGTTSLATLVNQHGFSDLVIGCQEGLVLLSAEDSSVGEDGIFHILSTDKAFRNPDQLFVAQAGNHLSVWSLTTRSDIYYQEFSREDSQFQSKSSEAIPHLSQKDGGGHFCALNHSKLGQDLFVIDGKSKMKRLEQNLETRLWQSRNVTFPDLENIEEFTSCTTLAKVQNAEGEPLIEYPLLLTASTSSEVTVDGRTMRINDIPHPIATDYAGSVTIILRGPELAAPILTLQDGAPGNGDKGLHIDPMSKLINAVLNVDSADGLRGIKLGSGASLIPSDVKKEDIDGAAKVLKELRAVAKELQTGTPAESSINATSGHSGGGLAMSSSAVALTANTVPWDLWSWLTGKFDDFVSWTVEKARDGWALVVKFAKGAYRFILETVTHIAQAVCKVFDAIKVGIESLIEWVGYLFNWDDIIATKNVFVNLTTSGILWGIDGIHTLDEKVGEFFGDMKSKIRILQKNGPSDSLANIQIGKNAAKDQQKGKGKNNFKEQMDSPGSNFGNYHLQNAGNTVDSQKKNQTSAERLADSFKDVFQKVGALTDSLSSNISKLFQSSDKSIGDLFAEMGLDLVLKILDLIESVVRAIIREMADLILEIAGQMNDPIHIPVLSPLYRKISDTELSNLDAVCLVLAIPATAIHKAVMKKSPSDGEDIKRLTKPNIYKQELDRRRGLTPNHQTTNFTAKVAHANSSVRTIQATESSSIMPTTESNTTKPGAPQSKPRAGQIVFEDDLTLANALKATMPPILAGAWFNCWTVPNWTVPDTGESAGWKKCLKFGAGALLLALQKPRETPEHRAQPGWALRMTSWLLDGFNVIGTLFSKKASEIIRIVVAVLQGVVLAFTQSEVIEALGKYDVFLAVDEWVNVISKILNGYCALANGAYPFNVFAVIWIDVGFVIRFVRMVESVEDKSKQITSGVDLGA